MHPSRFPPFPPFPHRHPASVETSAVHVVAPLGIIPKVYMIRLATANMAHHPPPPGFPQHPGMPQIHGMPQPQGMPQQTQGMPRPQPSQGVQQGVPPAAGFRPEMPGVTGELRFCVREPHVTSYFLRFFLMGGVDNGQLGVICSRDFQRFVLLSHTHTHTNTSHCALHTALLPVDCERYSCRNFGTLNTLSAA